MDSEKMYCAEKILVLALLFSTLLNHSVGLSKHL